MRKIVTIRRDSLPRDIIRHLEQQGLGWVNDRDLGDFRLVKETTNGPA
ncbi:MAG: hypothetical protein AAGL89_01250 [Pseudomonadota bacterium]